MATKTRSRRQSVKSTAAQQALAFARAAAGKAESWIELHNAVFGIGGKISELFPDQTSRARFVRTEEYQAIMKLIDDLMGGNDETPIAELLARANGKLLVRVPRAVHAALLAEAEAEDVSLNQLCASKLAVQLRAVVRG